MKWLLLLVSGLILLFPASASADLLAPIKINTGTDTARYPDASGNKHGQAIIAWSSAPVDPDYLNSYLMDQQSIYYSLRNSDGSYTEATVLENTNSDLYDVHPALADNGTGAVVYQTVRNYRSDVNIITRGRSSSLFRPSRTLSDSGGGTQGFLPSVDMANNGGGVVYESSRGNPSFNRFIVYNKIYANGYVGPKRILTSSAKKRLAFDPDIAVSNNGTTIVTWAEYNNKSNNWLVKAALRKPSGIWRKFNLAKTNSGEPKAGINERGEAYVVWYEETRKSKRIYGKSQIIKLAKITRRSTQRNLKIKNLSRPGRRAYAPEVVTKGLRVYTTWQSQPPTRSRTSRIYIESAMSFNGGRGWKRVSPTSSGFISWQARPAITNTGLVAAAWYGRYQNNPNFSVFYNQGFSELRKQYRIPLNWNTKLPQLTDIGPRTFLVVMTDFQNQYKGSVYLSEIRF
jgi:hypothetical protein